MYELIAGNPVDDLSGEAVVARSSGDTWDIVTTIGFMVLAVCAARVLDVGFVAAATTVRTAGRNQRRSG
jgi:hypothetical protein